MNTRRAAIISFRLMLACSTKVTAVSVASMWSNQFGGDRLCISSRTFTAALCALGILLTGPAAAAVADNVQSEAAPSDLFGLPKRSVIPPYPADALERATAPVQISGSGGVTNTGQATYAITIRAPDGPGGLKPDFSVDYGGSLANGRVGVGWELGGLSAIAPCKRTVASEGLAGGVTFSRDDSYCLDGHKLVTEKNLGTEIRYRTEVETYQRIVAIYAQPNDPQPAAFTVWRSDGKKATYQPLRASRIRGVDEVHEPVVEPGEVHPVYPIRTLVDTTGVNRIEYEYEEQVPGESREAHEFSYRISQISYSFARSTPRRWIRFVYEQRPDDIITYVFGVKSVIRQRLSSIEAYAPNPVKTERVWYYKLRYSTSGDTMRSLLSGVQLCDQFDTCGWERLFDWTGVSTVATEHAVTVTGQEFEPLPECPGSSTPCPVSLGSSTLLRFFRPSDAQLLLFDVDGDGIDDALYRTERTFIDIKHDIWSDGDFIYDTASIEYKPGKLWLRRSTEPSPLAGSGIDVTQILEPHDIPPIPPTSHMHGWIAHLQKSRVADLDGNGVPDFLVARTWYDAIGGWNSEWDQQWADQQPGDPEPACWGWSVTYCVTQPPRTLNLNKWAFGYTNLGSYPWNPDKSNAFDDVSISGPVIRINPAVALGWLDVLFAPSFQRTLADFDGDGRVEAVDAFYNTNVDILGHLGQDWSNLKSYHSPWPYLTQLASDPPGSIKRPFPNDWTCHNGRIRVTDVDGDGRDDVLAATDDVVAGGASTGMVTSIGLYARMSVDRYGITKAEDISKLWAGDCRQFDPDLVMADFNGDGLDDALYLPGSLNDNSEPLIRWNTGNGFGPLVKMPVEGSAGLLELLNQPVPIGDDGLPWAWDRGTRVADVNGDGRADIVAFRRKNTGCFYPNYQFPCTAYTTVVAIYLSAGDRLRGQIIKEWNGNGVSVRHGFTLAQVGDVTGDGAVDIVNVVDGKIVVLELPWRLWEPDRLKRVDEAGIPMIESFHYSRKWWGGVPRPAPESCRYPISCPRRGFTIVETHIVSGGNAPSAASMNRVYQHRYEDPRWDLQGRGFLGFRTHRIWDGSLGQETIVDFDNATRCRPAGGPCPPIDPDSSPAGAYYPFVDGPMRITIITPLKPLPPEPAQGSAGLMPTADTLAPPLEARVSITTRHYQAKSSCPDPATPDCLGGIRVLLDRFSTTEFETTVTAHVSDSLSYYDPVAMSGSTVKDKTVRSGRFEYDDFGNLTHEVAETEGGVRRLAWHAYDKRADRTDEAHWLIGLRTKTEMVSYDDSESEGASPNFQTEQELQDRVRRIVRTAYDDHGLPVEVRNSGRSKPAGACVNWTMDDPFEGCEKKGVRTTFDRNARGSITKVTSTAADEQEPRLVGYTYDPEGVYVVHRTDAADFTTTILRHPALGVPVLEVDELGISATAKYDGFGRLLGTSRPGKAKLTRSYSQVVENGYRATRIHDSLVDGRQAWKIHDQFDRPVRGALLGFDGTWITTRQEYNAYGLVARASRPGLNSPSPAATVWTYDRLRRPLSVTGPDGSTTMFEHGRFLSQTWHPEGNWTFAERDLEGRTVQGGHYVNGQNYSTVSLAYGDFDQVDRVTDAKNNVTHLAYDSLGHRIGLADPNSGQTEFEYDGFGELVKETRANGDVANFRYDRLGRLTETTGPDGKTTFTWDAGPNASARLVASQGPDMSTSYQYDSLGRIKRVTRQIGAEAYEIAQSYDVHGRAWRLFYPEAPGRPRFVIRYDYSGTGYPMRIVDVTPCGLDPEDTVESPTLCHTRELWRVLSHSNDRRVQGVRFGNTFDAARSYSPVTGRVHSISVSAAGHSVVYEYDRNGNVKLRADIGANRIEAFCYDPVDRLVEWGLIPDYSRMGCPLEGARPLYKYSYDELGNLETVKAGVDVMFSATYNAQGKPDAMASSTTQGEFTYDENGQQKTGAGRSITYSQYGLPRKIDAPTSSTTFEFDETGGRARKLRNAGDGDASTLYIGGIYERRSDQNGIADVYYVHAEPGVVAQVTYVGDSQQPVTRYLVPDGIGSDALVLDKDGAAIEKTYYDPFGGRVNGAGVPIDSSDPDPATTLGFTGHEHDGDGLINMRGRIYDRNQYRFITPDPFVPRSLLGQSYNPYSYALNNPLRYTDPSGFQTAPGVLNDAGQTIEPGPDGSIQVEVRGKRPDRPDRQIGHDIHGGSAVYAERPTRHVFIPDPEAIAFVEFARSPEYINYIRRLSLFSDALKGQEWFDQRPTILEAAARAVERSMSSCTEDYCPAGRNPTIGIEAAGTAIRVAPWMFGDAPPGALTMGASAGVKTPLGLKLSYVYAQFNTVTGEFAKWGATSIGRARYSQAWLKANDLEVVAVGWGSRAEMWRLERELTTRFPGGRNFEPWKGTLSPVSRPVTAGAQQAIDAAANAGIIFPPGVIW